MNAKILAILCTCSVGSLSVGQALAESPLEKSLRQDTRDIRDGFSHDGKEIDKGAAHAAKEADRTDDHLDKERHREDKKLDKEIKKML